MRRRPRASLTRLLPLALAGAWLPGVAHAADKASLACIQAAEEGETARNAGELRRARELFSQCAARECPVVLRRDCSSWLEDLDRQIPSVVVGAHDAQGHDVVDARVSVDGTPVRERLDGTAIELNPGPHVLRVERAGSVPFEIKLVVRAGEKNRPVLAAFDPPATATTPPGAGAPAPPPPPPRPAAPAAPPNHVPIGAYLLGGVGVAALGVFGYFAAVGQNDADKLRATCAPGCAHEPVVAARTKLIIADVAAGAGALALGAAVWIAIRGLTRTRDAAWNVVVAPSAYGATGGIVVRF